MADEADDCRDAFVDAVRQLVPAYKARIPTTTIADSAVQRLAVLAAECDARGDHAAFVYVQQLADALQQLAVLGVLPQTFREARLLTDQLVHWIPQTPGRSHTTLVDDSISLVLLNPRGKRLLDAVFLESVARTWTILASWVPGKRALAMYQANPVRERSHMLIQVTSPQSPDETPLFPPDTPHNKLEARTPVDTHAQERLLANLARLVPRIDIDGKPVAIKWKPTGPCFAAFLPQQEADLPRSLAAGAKAAMNLEVIAVLDRDRPKEIKGKERHAELAAHQARMLATLTAALPVRTVKNPEVEQPETSGKKKRNVPERIPNQDANYGEEILGVDAAKGSLPQRSTEVAIIKLTLVEQQARGGEQLPVGVEVAIAYRNTAGAAEAFLGLGTAGSLSLVRALQEIEPRKFLTPGGVCVRGPSKTLMYLKTPALEDVTALLEPGTSASVPRRSDSPHWVTIGPTGTLVTAGDYGNDGWVRRLACADPRAQPSPSAKPPSYPETGNTTTAAPGATRFAPSRGPRPPSPGSQPASRQTTTGTREPVTPPRYADEAPTAASTAKSVRPEKTASAKTTPKKTPPTRTRPPVKGAAAPAQPAVSTSPPTAPSPSARTLRAQARASTRVQFDAASPSKKQRVNPPPTQPSTKAAAPTTPGRRRGTQEAQQATRAPEQPAHRGLVNGGNRCCLIAPLQALRYLAPLGLDDPRNAIYVYAHQATPQTKSAKVSIELGKIFEAAKQDGNALDPASIYDAVMDFAVDMPIHAAERTSFAERGQQDAQDVLTYLLEAVDESPGLECALTRKNIEVRLWRQTRCLEHADDRGRGTDQSEWPFRLAMAKGEDVASAIGRTTRHPESKTSCSHCTKRDVDGVTVMGYTSLPDPFMIFVNTEDDVVISEELELSAIMDKETSSQSTSSRYELASAVFYRRGDEHAGGHYICYATPASTLGKHCLFDDTYVRLGENWQARTKDFKPYILFYVCKHRPVPAPVSPLHSPKSTLPKGRQPPTFDPSTANSPLAADPAEQHQRPLHATKAPRLHGPDLATLNVNLGDIARKTAAQRVQAKGLPRIDKLGISDTGDALLTRGDESVMMDDESSSSRMSVDSRSLQSQQFGASRPPRPSSRLSATAAPFVPRPRSQ